MIWTPDECAIFYRTRERLGDLSNMASGMPIRYEGREYPSSEALYQALRFPQRYDIHDAIIAASTPFLAKKTAYCFIDRTRVDWNDVKVSTMEMVLNLKVEQHPVRMRTVLDQTHQFPIVERSSRDRFWGAVMRDDGKLEGENVLGILWTIIRDESQ